jgi:RNA polymerase sigma-54 factor
VSLEELTEKSGHSLDELDDALCLIQDMDPPGVGARNLQECLLLQIKDYGSDRSLLTEIINKHLGLIEKRDFGTLSKKLGLTPKRTKDLADIIFTLEPKPGRAFGRGEAQYITPDVYVQKVGEEYVVILNEDGLPKLQISNFYKSAIMKEMAGRQNGGGKEAAVAVPNPKNDEAQGYIQEKLKSALWLIKSIHQRQKTLYKVTKSIAHFQKDFMDKGVQGLKPLVLRNVADEIGVHESTVSRATNGKYVHTPQGIFELKYFFNTGLSHATGGDDFANEAVKQMVKQFIAGENVKAPLSDQILASMLKQHNINIARRTVAKYREMLGILPSSRRKRAF